MPKVHTVAQGECLASIAAERGLAPDTIWDHPDNAALRRKRESGYVLAPGDAVVVPDLRAKHVPCGTARRHVFRRKGVPTPLRIRLLADGRPREDLPYRLVVDGRPIKTATTTGDGMIEAWIDPKAKRAVVVVETEAAVEEYEVVLGHLDPVTTENGVRQRLSNLGYLEDDGPDALASALRSFQLDEHVEPSGEPDGPTRERLVAVHGS